MTSTPDLPTARRAARTLLAALAIVSALPGCSLTRASAPVTTYDLGPPLSTQAAAGTLPKLRIAQTDGPTWMESNALYYRLQYSQAQRMQSYATQRWVIPPTQLFDGRLREAVAARGALTWFGDTSVPALKVDMLEFEQVFDSATDSRGVVRVRATVYQHGMIGQQTFTAREPAPSADGSGGVKALADATDKVIADMLAWAAGLPLQGK
ncbi:ABC-type transport auxiliary lipoprotein family protein [Cupriavidus pinatubonensis]|uniref:ABC-type transport auxiliary lipoprotein family protein n=1 Tax=Cupriavidus pinatubonensis TaxID=248026 RepID=UPI00112E0647|nr:ABC-type transport auxiliary lipoprotein family protein [Cupriavidus pinatubonensis]QYY31729.1 ABC-type transport auxiliary lipoprotein family protein [Cupriavidus pinatubonensis]TPQ29396.1 ABC transporter [Cupriavidus pinatubonensis]